MRKLFILFLLISVQVGLSAQQRNHMPYSIYGLGKMYPKGFTHNMAMGRSGIALSSSRYLNNINPASYHGIDSVSFFFDFGLSADWVKYQTNREGSQHGMDMNLRNIAMGFRISRNLSSSIGIAPYSSVGYKIQTTEIIEGTEDEVFDVDITGSGGLNQFYWNNSYKLFNHLSLGANFTYLFGNIESSEKVNAGGLSQGIILKQSSYLNKLYADFGFQFFFPVKKDFEVTLGGIFGNSHRVNLKDRFIITDSEGNISQDEVTRRSHFKLPYHAGGGIAVTYKNSLTLSADYLYYDWSNTPSDVSNFKYRSNNLYRVGLEFIPGRYSKLGYFGGIAYRAGFYYEESHLEIKNTRFSDNGFTAGLGLPFLQNRTSINISYNYGINGTLERNLIRENYHSIMFSLTLHDWWFIQRKID